MTTSASSENKKAKKIAHAALDVAKVGALAIPFVGGSIVEVVEVIQERHVQRVIVLHEHLIARLGDRVDALNEAMSDDQFVDLVDDAVEKAAHTRSNAQIRLLADVVATAVLGRLSAQSVEPSHVLLATVASIRPAHIEILMALGTVRNVNGELIAPTPSLGRAMYQRDFSLELPHLAQVLTPLLQDLRNAGLADASVQMVRSPIGESPWQLTEYGLWVLNELLAASEDDDIPSKS